MCIVEVNKVIILPIPQDDLKPLIETARCLQVKGLSMAQPNVVPPSHSTSTPRKRPHSQMIFPDKAKEARRLKVATLGPPRPLLQKPPLALPSPNSSSSPTTSHQLPLSPGQSEGDEMHNSSLESLDRDYRKEAQNEVSN